MESVHEEWRDVTGYEGRYQVSSLGRIRSLDRTIEVNATDRSCHGRKWRGRVLATVIRRGYSVINLGDSTLRSVHTIVARAFIGEPPLGSVVNHMNGVKHDNRPSNLEYTTNSGNVHHAYRTGLISNRGDKNGRSLITDRDAADIYKSDEPDTVLADRYGVRKYVISRIKSGERWSSVTAHRVSNTPP